MNWTNAVTITDKATVIDFDLTLDRYKRYGTDLSNVFEAGVFRKVLKTPSGLCLVSLCPSNDTVVMGVRSDTGMSDTTVFDIARHAANKILGLSFPLTSFYAFVRDDPILSGATERYYGLRPTLQIDPFEMLVSSITAQQINLKFAFTTRRRLVSIYGTQMCVNGQSHYTFPTPDRLAGLTEEDLRSLQFSGQKARYILNLARMVSSGGVDLSGIARSNENDIMQSLTALVGIGRWTVDWFLARFLGHGNAIAAGDLAVKRAIQHFYFEDTQVGEEQIRDFAARWGEFTNLAVHYLLAAHRSG